MDPFGALASFALGWMKKTALAQWVKLIAELLFSGVVSFLFVCGTLLGSLAIAGTSHLWPIAIGAGMVASAVSMTALWRASPLTKGLTVVLPQEEAAKEIETNLQTITKK